MTVFFLSQVDAKDGKMGQKIKSNASFLIQGPPSSSVVLFFYVSSLKGNKRYIYNKVIRLCQPAVSSGPTRGMHPTHKELMITVCSLLRKVPHAHSNIIYLIS